MIDRGADIHAHYGSDGHTVLHLAVLHQDGEMTKLLLDRKANPNARDNFKLTPLHITMLRNRTPYQPTIQSYYGLGATGTSDIELSVKPAQYLLNNGADVNAVSDREVSSSIENSHTLYGTPLNVAPINYHPGNVSMIMVLINAGGKILQCDPSGKHCELSDGKRRIVTAWSCDKDNEKCVKISEHELGRVDRKKRRRKRKVG